MTWSVETRGSLSPSPKSVELSRVGREWLTYVSVLSVPLGEDATILKSILLMRFGCLGIFLCAIREEFMALEAPF